MPASSQLFLISADIHKKMWALFSLMPWSCAGSSPKAIASGPWKDGSQSVWTMSQGGWREDPNKKQGSCRSPLPYCSFTGVICAISFIELLMFRGWAVVLALRWSVPDQSSHTFFLSPFAFNKHCNDAHQADYCWNGSSRWDAVYSLLTAEQNSVSDLTLKSCSAQPLSAWTSCI